MKRWLILAYGAAAYVMFFALSLYLVGFIGGFLTPTQLDGKLGTSVVLSLLIDVGLIAAFGLQHTVMARPEFKRRWTVAIPTSIERSTYVLASNIVLAVLVWQWRPLPGVLWDLPGGGARALAWSMFAFGWLAVFATTFLINHFDLFGLRQVWLDFRGRPYVALPFVTPWPYRWVRHPLYVGWILAFWCTPTMTTSHFVFAVGMTLYILAAIPLEERDLRDGHPAYADYCRRVPRLIPRLIGRGGGRAKTRCIALTFAAGRLNRDATPHATEAASGSRFVEPIVGDERVEVVAGLEPRRQPLGNGLERGDRLSEKFNWLATAKPGNFG